MIVYRDLSACENDSSVATVGYFDGIHLGHQHLLGDLTSWAKSLGSSAAVVTFHPHPVEVLRGVSPLHVISLPHRLLRLAQYGVDVALVLEFTRELASWSCEEFVERALVSGLGARHVVMGFDSAWGAERQGTFEYLSARASDLEVEIRQSAVEQFDGVRVSSTLVRDAVKQGNVVHLTELLGRPFSILGRVGQGDRRGRELGFPTANVEADDVETALPTGVYFAEVTRWGNRLDTIASGERKGRLDPTPDVMGLPAVVNLGRRPTFKGDGERKTLEVHLLDFDEDIYGEWLEVHFLQTHRTETKFSSAAELTAQVREDVGAFREYWSGRGGR